MTGLCVMMKRALALLFALTVFFMTSGFTYSPSAPQNICAYIEFNANDSGALVSSTDNVTVTEKNWYQNLFVKDGKAGVSRFNQYDHSLWMQVNKEVFKDIHKIKVTVEWYDAAGQPTDNFFSIQYPTTGGSYGQPSTKTNEEGNGTQTWVTTETIISDIDFTNTSTLQKNANLVLRAAGALTTHNTEDTADDYYGVLVHSIKIEPVEESYCLEQLYKSASAGYQAGETDETKNLTLVSPSASKLMTVTDNASVTKVGRAFATESVKEVDFILDQELFKDTDAVNLSVTWFDAANTDGIKNALSIRWQSTVQHPSWKNYLKDSGAKQQGLTGKWTTTSFTLTECDFSTLAGDKYNLHVYMTNGLSDMGTKEDTTDDIYGLLISEITIEPVDEYTFGGLKFTDENLTELSELNAGGDFHTELTVYRTGGSDIADVTLIAALIDENGKIERIAVQKVSMEPNTSKALGVCFKNPETVTGKSVRIMVWDSLSGIQPISNLLTCR